MKKLLFITLIIMIISLFILCVSYADINLIYVNAICICLIIIVLFKFKNY